MDDKLCVYTCITGNYDNLHEIEHPEKNIDYYCFTNNKNLKSKTWKIVQINNDGLTNHLLSRKIKMLGHPTILKKYDNVIWMDASVVWDKKINDFYKTYAKNAVFSSFKHSERTSIHNEAITCLRFGKDSKDNILKTLDFFKNEHFPDDIGLYEMTVFFKKQHNPKVIETMQLWFDIVSHYSRRDQLSFMYAVWKTGLKITPINLNVWCNEWFHTLKHTTEEKIQSCHIYYGNSNQDFDFNSYYVYKFNQKNTTYSLTTAIPKDTKIIEINPCNIIGTAYKDILISPQPNKISITGYASYPYNINVFYTSHNTIRVYGNFKKNQIFSFSINMEILNKSILASATEHFWFINQTQAEQIHQLKNQLNELQNQFNSSSKQLQDITNSKSYKTMLRVRKLFPPY